MQDLIRQLEFRRAFDEKELLALDQVADDDLQLPRTGRNDAEDALVGCAGNRAGPADDFEHIRIQPVGRGKTGIAVGVEAIVDPFGQPFLKGRPAESPAQFLLGLLRASHEQDRRVENGILDREVRGIDLLRCAGKGGQSGNKGQRAQAAQCGAGGMFHQY